VYFPESPVIGTPSLPLEPESPLRDSVGCRLTVVVDLVEKVSEKVGVDVHAAA